MSLDGNYDQNNIFARILRKEIPCWKVFEDETALAFMDVFPQSYGHTLVIPRVSVRNFLEMPDAMVGPYMQRVHSVAQAVRSALQPDGLIITQFNGAPAGQTVFHLHFHIIPRWEDKVLAGHGLAAQADSDSLRDVAAKIAAAF
jgi:histidine triad (HIT) family protein